MVGPTDGQQKLPWLTTREHTYQIYIVDEVTAVYINNMVYVTRELLTAIFYVKM